MNRTHLFLVIAAGCCLLQAKPLAAQAPGAPFDVSQQYSAEMVLTPREGQAMTQKINSDNGKIRSEMNMSGMEMISIVRPDLKKVYTVMVAQKMVMEIPYDPSKYPVPTTTQGDAKFEVIGPDTVEGVACTKYKMTAKDGKVAFFWVDTSKKALVKMEAADGSVTAVWKNFVAGPQPASLFEPPADYKVMNMPSMPHMPGAVPGAMPSNAGK